jgi:hypothetical protein
MAIDIVEFVTDDQLLGLSISPAQETLLRGIYGLPLRNDKQRDLWTLCTGGRPYREGHRFAEVTVLAGARSGKDSRIAAPIIVYEVIFGGHEKHLARGERGVFPIIAQDGRAARVAFGYVRDYLLGSPFLKQHVAGDPKMNEIDLVNRLAINCFPCTLRSTRGFSMPVGCLDELAYFRLEGQVDSDEEVQASVRRGMLAFPHTLLVKISTPYMKGGVLYDDFKRAFGQNDPDLLVWKASSVLMNPMLRAERLERERRLDASRFAREYEAEFQDDLSGFLPAAWVEQAVQPSRHELAPRDGVTYLAAADPSGGGPDAFTFSIAHREGDRVVQDVIRGYARVGHEAPNLAAVVKEIADTLRRYRIREVWHDKYAGSWVKQEFQRAGITSRESDLDRSKAYLETEPLFAQGRIELLDHPQQTRELKLLEKRLRPGGGATVDHPRGGHDDHANALALAAAKAMAGNQLQYRVRVI